MKNLLLAGAAAIAILVAGPASAADKLLNASYDVARELFVHINEGFKKGHPDVKIEQSHAGTSKQARSIVEGLGADVVTFNQVPDIDFLVKNGLVAEGWQTEFPNQSSPWYSLPSFLVRAGNPKNIKDWGDLVRDDVQVIFPNPKTSGNARYTYLAATAWAKENFKGDEAKVKEYVTDRVQPRARVRHRRPRRDDHLRRARDRRRADHLRIRDHRHRARSSATDKFEQIVPSVSLLAEFPVAIVDKVVDEHGSRELAKTYLDYLYSPEGQKIAAENGNRVRDEKVAEEFKDQVSQCPSCHRRGRVRGLDKDPGRAFCGWRPARPDFRQPVAAGHRLLSRKN